jgi:hypothetical protein
LSYCLNTLSASAMRLPRPRLPTRAFALLHCCNYRRRCGMFLAYPATREGNTALGEGMQRHAVVRADGGHEIGTGHLARTLLLADRLKESGARVTFASYSVDGCAALLQRCGHELVLLPPISQGSSVRAASAVCALEPALIVNDIRDTWAEYVPAHRLSTTGEVDAVMGALEDVVEAERARGVAQKDCCCRLGIAARLRISRAIPAKGVQEAHVA